MQTGGWRTKNWSDFTCYSSDGKTALAMEPLTEEIHRWSIYVSTPEGGWTVALHNMEHGVFCARRDGKLLEGDILSMKLEGDTLFCRGELLDDGRLAAECEAAIKLSEVDGLEVFSIRYRYEFREPGPFEVLQQYDTPLGSAFSPRLFLPPEGVSLSWDQEYSSMRATLFVDEPVDKHAEFGVGLHVE